MEQGAELFGAGRRRSSVGLSGSNMVGWHGEVHAEVHFAQWDTWKATWLTAPLCALYVETICWPLGHRKSATDAAPSRLPIPSN